MLLALLFELYQCYNFQVASTVTELCTGFETSKKKNEEMGEQVTDLEGQIQKWKDQKASRDVKKQELQRESDEA